ncbi:MAG: rRNA maturation RNase YbeY [Bacteroidia bacterium]|nr:rRNA maturation RNase YbeY [Bacteroidia bacterium]
MAISFQNQDIDFKLKHKTKIKSWIKKVIESQKKKKGEINFVFTNDEELLDINTKFLQHSTYTDIITFDSCEGKVINGDIIISVERVAENAKKFKVSFETELHRVMIHGVLHLLGYKDKSKKEAAEMRLMEDWALRKF